MDDGLKKIGISFKDPKVVEQYYVSLRGIMINAMKEADPKTGIFLDLNALPTQPLDLKATVIKWLIEVNMERIKGGSLPVIALEVVLRCPVWKIVSPPLRKIAMTPEAMFNQPTVKTIGKKYKVKGINKR